MAKKSPLPLVSEGKVLKRGVEVLILGFVVFEWLGVPPEALPEETLNILQHKVGGGDEEEGDHGGE